MQTTKSVLFLAACNKKYSLSGEKGELRVCFRTGYDTIIQALLYYYTCDTIHTIYIHVLLLYSQFQSLTRRTILTTGIKFYFLLFRTFFIKHTFF
jgi:hypothetical protein